MFPARQFTFAVTALLLAASAYFVSLFSVAESRAEKSSCEETAEVAMLPSPSAPWNGAPLRILAAVEKPLDGELKLIAPG